MLLLQYIKNQQYEYLLNTSAEHQLNTSNSLVQVTN